eukprot:5738574-Amphidinium_carterae.3
MGRGSRDCEDSMSEQMGSPAEEAADGPIILAAQKTRAPCLGEMSSLKQELCLRIAQKGIPKHYTRTNVSLFGPPRSLLLGAVTTRGCGVTKATASWAEELAMMRELAACRKDDAEYVSVMVNQTDPRGLPGHQDIHNDADSVNWLLPLGDFSGGPRWGDLAGGHAT